MSPLGLLVEIGLWAGLVVFLFGLGKLLYVPLAIAFEIRGAYGKGKRPSLADESPFVSIIIPAYNEAVVLESCIRSVLSSDYPSFEIVVVDDGSTDDTRRIMRRMQRRDKRVRTRSQANGGKGAALNAGIKRARGDVLLFVDADGLFLPNTITELLRGFDDERIGGVCGDDRPRNLDGIQTRLLSLMSHVGTGMVRRALDLLHCLPIVSGNIGAFRRSVIEQVGGFREDTVGEDLELTWRVRKAGHLVTFRPNAIVFAESPSTLVALWRQRVRWARGLLQTMRSHWGMIGNPRYGIFGMFLALNSITMVVIPIVQLALLIALPFAVGFGGQHLDYSILEVIGWLGLGVSLGIVVVAALLNRAWYDLRFLWCIVLWPVYSIVLAAVVARALWQERNGERAPWNKLVRTGTVSAHVSRRLATVRE
jgi:cellulose synthase/poly-beta-1,6-N-acetylglucosamine synthase-like glycosyltransferase